MFGVLVKLLLAIAQRRDDWGEARWSELSGLDGDYPLLSVPAARYKVVRVHEVPLTPLVVDLLRSLHEQTVRETPVPSGQQLKSICSGLLADRSDGSMCAPWLQPPSGWETCPQRQLARLVPACRSWFVPACHPASSSPA